MAAIAFEYINGFHDAANAIATVVSTKVLTPRQAIAMAAFFNLTGALTGRRVASTIGKGIVDTNVVTMATVLCALHRRLRLEYYDLVARFAFEFQSCADRRACAAPRSRLARGDWSVLKWNTGLWPKVVVPMITSPVARFPPWRSVMFALFLIFHRFTPHVGPFRLREAATRQRGLDGAFSHGTNDAQKTMGIITLALFTGTKAGSSIDLPPMF